ncbi:MAG: T9SS type A sorting domain-containing protein [Bacteroidetes bacterium]|nr:T9SS type A sorting domain-containing protein [Bacteroidota bacterium]
MNIKKLSFIIVAIILSNFAQAQPQWQLYGDLNGGMCNKLQEVDGDLFAAFEFNQAAGGIWRTQNNGQSWIEKTAGLNSNHVRDIVNWNNTLVVATYDTVYYSTDKGDTWNPMNNGLIQYTGMINLCVHNNKLYGNMSTPGGLSEIWKLDVLNGNWTNTGFSLFSTNYYVTKLESIGNAIYALTNWQYCLLKSTDEGVTWNNASNGIAFNVSALALGGRNDTLYLSAGSDIYNSLDGGQSWNQASNGLFGQIATFNFLVDGNTIYCIAFDSQLSAAPFGGGTWTTVVNSGLPQKVLCRSFTKYNGSYFVGIIEGIYKSSGGVNSFAKSSTGITNTIIQKIFKRGNDFLASLSSQAGIYASTNNGVNWAATNNSNNDVILDFAYFNNEYIAGGFGTIYRSPTAMGPYAMSFSLTGGITKKFMNWGSELYMTTNNGIWKSTDAITWTNANNGLPANVTYDDLINIGTTWFTTQSDDVYRSTNAGQSWTLDNAGIVSPYFQRKLLANGNRVWLCELGFIHSKLLTDSAWQLVNLQYSGTREIIYYQGNLISGDRISIDDGAHWQNYNDGFKNDLGAISDIREDNGKLYAATQGSSLWSRDAVLNITNVQTSASSLCSGTSLNVSFSSALTFNSDNTFYVLLSDSNGFFAKADTIGSLMATTASSIACSIPTNVAQANNYKIKVFSTSPAVLTETMLVPVTIYAKAKIQLQPANQKTCENQNTAVYCYATGSNLQYTWQADTGTGYFNLQANSYHVSVNQPLMYLTNPQAWMDGNKYRCIVSGECNSVDTSTAVTLNVSNVYASIIQQPTDSAICEFYNAAFTVAGNNISSYQWQVDMGSGTYTDLSNSSTYIGTKTSQLYIQSAAVALNGYKYRCKLGECSYSNEATLYVNSNTVINAQPQDAYSCGTGMVVFQVKAIASGIIYEWEVDSLNGSGFQFATSNSVYNGSSTNLLQLTNVSASMNGFKFRCGIYNSCNFTVTYTQEVILNYNAAPSITLQPVNLSICENANAQFVAQAAAATTYLWYINSGNGWSPLVDSGNVSGVTNDTLQLGNVNTSYNGARIRCLIGGCAFSDSASLIVNTNPIVTLATQPTICLYNGAINLTGGSPSGGTYSGTAVNNGFFDPLAAGVGIHAVTYIYTASNGCADAAIGTIGVDNCLSIPEKDAMDILVFPNPTNTGMVTIRTTSASDGTQLILSDTHGRICLQQPLLTNEVQLNIEKLSPGVYNLLLYSKENRIVRRIVKL